MTKLGHVQEKTVADLIKELQSFDDKSLPVYLSASAFGEPFRAVLVGKDQGRCVISGFSPAPM